MLKIKYNKLIRLLHILFLLILLGLGKADSFAQKKTIVLTRKVEKQFVLKKNPKIFINSERGIIIIKSWDRNVVKVTLKLIAKNTDVNLAREELNQMNYALSEARNRVFVSNGMQLSKQGKTISSVIRAEYEILVPRDIEIHLDNKFGNVMIENVSGRLFGNLYYSDISLLKYSGDINLHISTGDFTCSKSKLKGEIFTRHAFVSINETEGKLRLETEYGKIQLIYDNLKLYAVLATQATDINIVNKKCYPIEMFLYAAYCLFEVEEDCYIPHKQYLESSYKSSDKDKAWELRYLPPDKVIRLIIYARFGAINLR